jgi:nucleoside-diphosphate-sugar epimerase
MAAYQKRALVSSGAGLIGSHIADLLLREGWLVRHRLRRLILRQRDWTAPQLHASPDSQLLIPRARAHPRSAKAGFV